MVAFVGAGNASSTTAGSLAVTPHASTADGHVMIAVITVRTPNLADNAITPPGGWTPVHDVFDSGSPGVRTNVYRRTASGEGSPYSWTFNSSNESCGSILTYSGVDTAAPIHAEDADIQGTGSATRTTPSINVAMAGCWVLSWFADRSGSDWTGPDTERSEVKVPATSASQVVCDTGATVSPGSVSKTATATASSSVATHGIIALAPPGVSLGRATGTGVARALAVARNYLLGRVTGTGQPQALTAQQAWVLGRVTGTGQARPLTAVSQNPGHTLLPELSIQVAFSAGANTGTALHLDDPTRGLLDTATLGDGTADEPTFVELGHRFNEGGGRIERGSQRVDSPIIRYETGNATLPLDNDDRALDPNNLDGPYVDPGTGKTRVTAMRAVRVRARWDGVVYELLRGTADRFHVDWFDPGHSITTLTASDAMKILAGIDRTAVPEVGADEDTGARINRILDGAGWGAEDRLVAVGDTLVQATTLAGDALAELQLVADTEIGELYVDGGGRVVFRNRNALLQDERSNVSQATFGDASGELPYKDLGTATDDDTFFNEVPVTRASAGEGDDPVEQVASDTASQALFYRRTFRPPSPPILRTDADALNYARWLLRVASQPELRFTQMVIEPAVQPADLWPQALGRQIGDRITIRRRPPGGGDPIVMDCFIRGILHELGKEEWLTTFTLQSASRFGGFLVLDNETLGRLDENALAY